MADNHLRFVILAAVLTGITVFALLQFFGPIAAIPGGGAGGLVIILCALAGRRARPPAVAAERR